MKALFFCRKNAVVFLILMIMMLSFPVRTEAASAAATTTPSPLTETTLNGAVIRIVVSGDQFIPGVTAAHFDLVNEPAGTTKNTVTLINATTVDLTLAFAGDFDSDKTNFYVKVFKEGLQGHLSDVNTNNISIKAVTEQISVVAEPAPLEEDTLNGTILTVTLTGDKYVSSLTNCSFLLIHPVAGLSIGYVERLSDTVAAIHLAFTGIDFDGNETDFAVRVLGTALARTTTDITSPDMTIFAIVEGTPSILATTRAYQVYENALNGGIVQLTARQATFINPAFADYYVLNNPPPGTYIHRVNFINNNTVEIELGYLDIDFDTDYTTVSVTATGSANSTGTPLTSNNITIIAIKDPGVRRNFINSNQSYPTVIQHAGYDIKNYRLHLNITLHTEKAIVPGQTATFYYYVVIYDNNENLIGEVGTDTNMIVGSDSSNAYINNLAITLNYPITVKYKVFVTVAKVIIQ